MPLFGHHNQTSGMRENEQVLGKWRTHHGDFELTNQRVLLVKAAGVGGMIEGHHEISWGVDLDAIENMQVVDAGGHEAAQAAASGASTFSSLANPIENLAGKNAGHLIINGQSITFHELAHANAAQAQIVSARDVRMKQLGKA